MSAQRPGQMLPESCGCRTPPSFPTKTSDSEEVSIRPSTTRRCLRRSGGIPTSSRGRKCWLPKWTGGLSAARPSRTEEANSSLSTSTSRYSFGAGGRYNPRAISRGASQSRRKAGSHCWHEPERRRRGLEVTSLVATPRVPRHPRRGKRMDPVNRTGGPRDTTAERTLDRRRSSRMSTLPDVVAGRHSALPNAIRCQVCSMTRS